MTSRSLPERVPRLAVIALLALGPAGCSAGGASRLTAAEFTRQAEAICTRTKAASTGDTTGPQQAADALRTMLDALGELEPPSVTEKEFQAFLRTGRAYLQIIAEPAADGQAKVDEALRDKFAADARAAGLSGCARALP